MKVKQPKVQPAVVRGLLAFKRGTLSIRMMDYAVEEAIESLEGKISSYTQPSEPYDRFDWMRMQTWMNELAALKKLKRSFR